MQRVLAKGCRQMAVNPFKQNPYEVLPDLCFDFYKATMCLLNNPVYTQAIFTCLQSITVHTYETALLIALRQALQYKHRKLC